MVDSGKGIICKIYSSYLYPSFQNMRIVKERIRFYEYDIWHVLFLFPYAVIFILLLSVTRDVKDLVNELLVKRKRSNISSYYKYNSGFNKMMQPVSS